RCPEAARYQDRESILCPAARCLPGVPRRLGFGLAELGAQDDNAALDVRVALARTCDDELERAGDASGALDVTACGLDGREEGLGDGELGSEDRGAHRRLGGGLDLAQRCEGVAGGGEDGEVGI